MRKLLIGLAVLLMAGVAQAALYTWDGGGGNTNWFNAANWDANIVPTTDDTVIGLGGATVDINGAAVCASIKLQNSASTLNIASAGSLDMSSIFGFEDVSAGVINWLGSVNGGGISQFAGNQMNISGTATGSLGSWCLLGSTFTLTITGSDATLAGSNWGIDNLATAKWVFDATGISPITLSGDIKLDALLGWGWWESGPPGREGGDLVIDLSAYAGLGGTFTLLDGPDGVLEVGEEFNNVTFVGLGSYTATVNYGDGPTGTGDVTVDVVPEPATLALLGLGGLGLLARRRR